LFSAFCGTAEAVPFQDFYFFRAFLANVGSLRNFERFLRACALRSANLLNKADLARDVGIAPSTANQWLSMLEAAGQAVLLEPWFSNRTKSIVKSPKLTLQTLACFALC
jgi:predicted AAA+ superfamily ATPase